MRSFVLPAALVAGVALAVAAPAAAQTDASPVPTSMPEGPAASPVPTGSPPSTLSKDLDPEVTKKALATISYRDCGKGGPGKLLVTFNPKGTVERVVLAEGTWEPNVAVCVTRRFMEATIPPFEGASHTVKWSVALEGGAPPPAAAAYAPAAAEYPRYPVRFGTGDDVMPADDGPAPFGYHREERRRVGALVSGSIITAMGLVFAAMAYDDSSSRDNETLQGIALVHIAVGLPLFIVGLTKRDVFVVDRPTVSLAPTLTKSSATFGLSVRF